MGYTTGEFTSVSIQGIQQKGVQSACKCLFPSPLVHILPVGSQESTLPEKFTPVLGQT